MNNAVWQMEIPVRWRDLDAYNHVNNASFLGYIEEARVSWFSSMSDNWAGASESPILAAVNINYRRPISWPETLRVELFCQRIGNKSLTLGHRIFSTTAPDLLYADGNTVLVWINREGLPVPLPESIRAACSVV